MSVPTRCTACQKLFEPDDYVQYELDPSDAVWRGTHFACRKAVTAPPARPAARLPGKVLTTHPVLDLFKAEGPEMAHG